MNRYKKVSLDDVAVGDKVRATLRHPDGWATLIYEGPVKSLFYRTPIQLLPDSSRKPDIVAGFWGPGDQQFRLGPNTDWHIVTVETSLPPLPTTPGSIVRCGNRAAVLREGMDPYMRNDEPTKEWIWADVLGHQQTDRGPTEEQLCSAEILHDAGRR